MISRIIEKEISKGISRSLAIHETIKTARKVTTNPIIANLIVCIAPFIFSSFPADNIKDIPPIIMKIRLSTNDAIIARATNVAIMSTMLPSSRRVLIMRIFGKSS